MESSCVSRRPEHTRTSMFPCAPVALLQMQSVLVRWTCLYLDKCLYSTPANACTAPVPLCLMKLSGWTPAWQSQGIDSFLPAAPAESGAHSSKETLKQSTVFTLQCFTLRIFQLAEKVRSHCHSICADTKKKVEPTCFSSSVQIIWKLVKP